ncbi:MAG: polysaccharide deacetylase family protein [Bacteroidales bacterium]
MSVCRLLPCIRWFYPEAVSVFRTDDQLICLTFDDGPDPDSTPEILDTLARHKIKAIFFCTGERAGRYPQLISQIIEEGHTTGNHTYGHIDGLIVSVKKYLDNVEMAAPLTSYTIFRPPYGRMRPGQYKALSEVYKIILWDLMVCDYKKNVTGDSIVNDLFNKLRPGSIMVMHDKPVSVKKKFLGRFIESCINSGYSFIVPDFNI